MALFGQNIVLISVCIVVVIRVVGWVTGSARLIRKLWNKNNIICVIIRLRVTLSIIPCLLSNATNGILIQLMKQLISSFSVYKYPPNGHQKLPYTICEFLIYIYFQPLKYNYIIARLMRQIHTELVQGLVVDSFLQRQQHDQELLV